MCDLASGELRYLELACYPQKVGNGIEPVDAALVTVQDRTDGAQMRRALEETLARQRAETDRLTTLMSAADCGERGTGEVPTSSSTRRSAVR